MIPCHFTYIIYIYIYACSWVEVIGMSTTQTLFLFFLDFEGLSDEHSMLIISLKKRVTLSLQVNKQQKFSSYFEYNEASCCNTFFTTSYERLTKLDRSCSNDNMRPSRTWLSPSWACSLSDPWKKKIVGQKMSLVPQYLWEQDWCTKLLNSQPRIMHFAYSDWFTQSWLSAHIP